MLPLEEGEVLLLLAAGFREGAVELWLVVLLREGCCTLGGVLLLVLDWAGGAVLLLTAGFGAVERVLVLERSGMSRDGCFTCGAVLLPAF